MFDTNRTYIDLVTTGLSHHTGVKVKASKSWKADVKNKILYYDLEGLKTTPFQAVKGILLHEIGHLKYTKGKPITRLQKKYPILQQAYNALEDIRIEKKLIDEYEKFAESSLGESNNYALEEFLERATFIDLPKIMQFIWLVMLEGLLDEPRIDDYLKETIRLRKNGKFAPEIVKRFNKNYHLIETIIYKCRKALSTPELKKIIDSQLVPIIEDYLKANPKLTQEQNIAIGKEKCIGDQAKKHPEKKALEKLEEIEVQALLDPYINTLAERLKDILKENSISRYTGSYRKGKLLQSNAYKIAINDNKAFSKKINPNTPYYHFHILLDSSGSMLSDNKASNAFIGSCLVKKLSEILNFPFSSYNFDEDFYKLDDLNDYKKSLGGGTDDLEALTQLEKTISKDNDNIVLIFTDGYAYGDLETIINKIESKNSVMVGIGFGEECSTGVRERYANHLIVDKPDDLLTGLISKMRELIKR